MRTTVTLDPIVAVAIEQLCRTRSLSLDEALNQLALAGTSTVFDESEPFVLRSYDLGVPRHDIACIGELLEKLDGPDYK